jgi:hypothetical protein
MESVDVVLIKLHGVVKDKEKSVVSRLEFHMID